MLTFEEIERICRSAREQYEEPWGHCRRISITVRDRLCDRLGDDADKVHGYWEYVGDETQHYVVYVDGSVVEGVHPNRYLLVDPSFDQFCAENVAAREEPAPSFGPRETLDAVRLLRPEDDRRTQYAGAFFD